MAAARKKLRVSPVVTMGGVEVALPEVRRQALDRFSGYQLRGLWFRKDSYGALRNAAWLLRNSRVGQVYNPAALMLVVREADKLLNNRETLRDVLEAFAELLVHP